MSDANTNPKPTSKLPTHHAYQVRKREGGKPVWTRIGASWAHADGKGFNIQIESVPLDGRITLRVVGDNQE